MDGKSCAEVSMEMTEKHLKKTGDPKKVLSTCSVRDFNLRNNTSDTTNHLFSSSLGSFQTSRPSKPVDREEVEKKKRSYKQNIKSFTSSAMAASPFSSLLSVIVTLLAQLSTAVTSWLSS